jgi:hypothetical protein
MTDTQVYFNWISGMNVEREHKITKYFTVPRAFNDTY